MLDDIALYWLTNSAACSARIYSDNNNASLSKRCGSEDRGDLPAYRESYTRCLIYDRILFVHRFKTNDRVVFAP
jgi:hypothetical protein